VAGLLGTAFFIPNARADEWNKKTIFTINEPIQVSDRLLEPGQYVFKLLNSSSDRHIVQIFNADETQIIDTIIAIPNYRLQPTGKSRFTFWETPQDRVKALRAWFYPGDNFGQEFRYPKEPAMAATGTATVSTAVPIVSESEGTATVAVAEVAPAPQPDVTPAPAPEPAPAVAIEETPAPAPAPATAESIASPATLPQTASNYPLAGLAGLLSLGCFWLLRRRTIAAN
jgi:LPXTG-motif cell wall-anchored protein